MKKTRKARAINVPTFTLPMTRAQRSGPVHKFAVYREGKRDRVFLNAFEIGSFSAAVREENGIKPVAIVEAREPAIKHHAQRHVLVEELARAAEMFVARQVAA